MLYKGFRNLMPNSDIKDAWLATNKGSTSFEIGAQRSEFRFPGFWTIKNFSSDVTMFYIAIFFEIVFLLLIFTQAGVQLFLIIASLLSVIIDFISALAHNSKRKEISIACLKVNIAKYLFKLDRVTNPEVRQEEKELKKYKNNVWRITGAVLIVMSWLVKIFVTAITFGLPIIIFASVVIFGFVAYIHLFHTGYAFSGFRFYSSLKKILYQGNTNFVGKDTDNDFDYVALGNDKEIKDAGVTLFEIKNKIEGVNIPVYDSLVHNMQDGIWQIKKWKYHFWDDKDMENFIKSSDDSHRALAPEAQAFVAYKVCQLHFLTNIQ